MTSFLDPAYLNELMAGSHENRVLAVSEAVSSRRDLFGEGAEAIATYEAHAIVLNPESGEAWRAQYESSQIGGVVSIIGATPVSIPTRSEHEIVKATKDAADAVVDAMLGGKDQETLDGARELLALAQEGVNLTMQTVEAEVESFSGSDFPWRDELRSSESEIGKYLGSDAKRDDVPAPKFGDALASSDDEENIGVAAEGAMTELVQFFSEMSGRLKPAMMVGDDWEVSGDGEPMLVPSQFVDFVEGLGEDIEEMAGYAEDSLASSDTDPVALARVYDMLAAFAGDVWTGVVFAEKLASNFQKAG